MHLFGDDISIEPAFREALRDCGLDSVAGVLARVEGGVAAWSRTTDTLHVESRRGNGFYVKRYLYPRWRNRIRGLFRGTFFGACRAAAEYKLLDEMRGLGLPAVRPVAWGARRCGRFLTACFLITEGVPDARNLTAVAADVAAGQVNLTFAQRRGFVRRLASQVAALHATHFSHGQLFWRNLLLRRPPQQPPEYLFLDPRPGGVRRRGDRALDARLHELGQLAASALPFTSRGERLRFLLAYRQAPRLTPELRQCWRQIARLADHWKRHETQRIRMSERFEEWRRHIARDAPPRSTSLQPALTSLEGRP